MILNKLEGSYFPAGLPVTDSKGKIIGKTNDIGQIVVHDQQFINYFISTSNAKPELSVSFKKMGNCSPKFNLLDKVILNNGTRGVIISLPSTERSSLSVMENTSNVYGVLYVDSKGFHYGPYYVDENGMTILKEEEKQ